jgi:Helix-loop-helix DNA-binding domain
VHSSLDTNGAARVNKRGRDCSSPTTTADPWRTGKAMTAPKRTKRSSVASANAKRRGRARLPPPASSGGEQVATSALSDAFTGEGGGLSSAPVSAAPSDAASVSGGNLGRAKCQLSLPAVEKRRRQSHNATEQRRRQKINQCIDEIKTLCGERARELSNKAMILSTGIAYLRELIDEVHRVRLENVLLRQQVTDGAVPTPSQPLAHTALPRTLHPPAFSSPTP